MAKERACMICGRHYKFCHHCKEFEQEPKWKYLYHDEKCKQIGDIWYAYRGGEISKENAKKALSKLKPNIDDALKYTGTIASNEIRDIFDVGEEKPITEENVQNVLELNAEDKIVEDKIDEEQVVSEKQPTKRRTSKKESRETE